MKQLRDQHGAECFLLAYDQFTASRAFVEEFCTRMIDEGLSRQAWYCISRLDTVDAGLLKLMRAAGCESMCYGIDSGSPRTLAFIRKQVDVGVLPQRVRETTEAGMVPTLSFVVGFPEEERADIDATLALALEAGSEGNSNPLIQIPTVLPGTELHGRYHQRLVRAVDSYFAQGIEFDGGQRFPRDEALIDADPSLFSSFYNLPCPGVPLPELGRLAADFPLLVNLYPKSFLLLGRALETSLSLLFREFCDWLAAEPDEGCLTPARCFRDFPQFAAAMIGKIGRGWHHLTDVVAYETRAIAVARPGPPARVGNADLSGAGDWRPALRRNVLLARFAYDLPRILADLRAGEARCDYPQAPCLLVFRHARGQLEVSALNDFGHEFLRHCDGRRGLEEIAATLYPRFGQGQEWSAFVAGCSEAAGQLAALALLNPGRSAFVEPSPERR